VNFNICVNVDFLRRTCCILRRILLNGAFVYYVRPVVNCSFT